MIRIECYVLGFKHGFRVTYTIELTGGEESFSPKLVPSRRQGLYSRGLEPGPEVSTSGYSLLRDA